MQDFGEHLLQSAIVAPLKGAYQLADKAAGDFLPDVEIAKPKSASTGAALGDMAGTAAVFIGSALVARSAFKNAGLIANPELSLMRRAGISSLELGTAGSLVGLVQPIDSNRSDFWSLKARSVAHTGASFALTGALAKGLSSSRAFGLEGERTIHQALSLNATAGGVAGFGDAFLRAGLMENRLPTGEEALHSSLSFAAMGAGLGALEHGLSSAFRPSNLKHGLALDASGGGTANSEANAISQMLKRPLPNFKQIENSVPELPMSRTALSQSQSYVETGLIRSRIEDGTRLATVTDSAGFAANGVALNSAERFIVVDRVNDKVLRAVIDDAKDRFAGQAAGPELASNLRNYVSELMNRHNLPPSSLEQLYEETLRRNGNKLLPLGLFVQKGSGVCLPGSALFKTLADELGLQAQLREGFVGIKKPQPHVWPEVDFAAKYQIYDPSHPPNPAYRYISTKH